eukprot:TRINITY_DN7736_c0_g1_i1.p1 TRINITY_DN7736_c0_g1~~TRINITY_DN7736_c0_g1_i1.p1  ORF type:complete len:155 (+),score=32.03 TRINITY_DN7736_c0_g1_i1:1360-1824(+)
MLPEPLFQRETQFKYGINPHELFSQLDRRAALQEELQHQKNLPCTPTSTPTTEPITEEMPKDEGCDQKMKDHGFNVDILMVFAIVLIAIGTLVAVILEHDLHQKAANILGQSIHVFYDFSTYALKTVVDTLSEYVQYMSRFQPVINRTSFTTKK